MRTQLIVTVCGAAIGLAQGAATLSQAERTQQSRATASNATAPSVLQKLEGIWRVEVQMNGMYFDQMSSKKKDSWKADPSDRDMDRNMDRNMDRDSKARDAEDKEDHSAVDNLGTDDQEWIDDVEDRDSNKQDSKNRDSKDQDSRTQDANRTTRDGSKTSMRQHGDTCSFSGVAMNSLILDDGILQSRTRILAPNGQPSESGVSEGSFRPMEAVSLFSFDESNDSYSAVFMSSLDGSMHYDTGTYNASSRRIEFNGSDARSSNNRNWTSPSQIRDADEPNSVRDANRDRLDRSRQDGATDRLRSTDDQDANRRDSTRQNTDRQSTDRRNTDHQDANRSNEDGKSHGAGSHGWSNHGNVRVVLEVIDNDTHRVTMYGSSMPMHEGAGATSSNHSTTSRSQDGGATSGADSTTSRDRNASSLGENVIYQATYTRVSDSQESRVRSLLGERQSDDRQMRQERDGGSQER